MAATTTQPSEKPPSDSFPDEKSDHAEIAKIEDDPEGHAMRVAREEKWRVDEYIESMEQEVRDSGRTKGRLEMNPKSARHFTWVMVIFASMGGMLYGLDQSLISTANLFLPDALDLDADQVSMVNSALPLGAVGGAILLTPTNEFFGRRMAIIIATILYTLGAGLKAGARDYGMMISGRVIMGLGMGIETGTVPIYVAETVERRLRGNLVSLYQFNIALGEVVGYAVGAMFFHVKGNWRYILGSSVVFSIAMFLGMLVLPESPRFLMYKNRQLEAYRVWRRIRDMETEEARAEFYVMKESVQFEMNATKEKGAGSRWVIFDFITNPRARRAFIYANVMILLGQLVGINGLLYYLGTLMQQVGFDKEQATYMSMVGGGALFIGTIPAIFTMERFGRRFWALLMLPIFFIGLVLVGVGYLYDPETEPVKVQGLYLTGLIIYMLFYGPYACLTWVIPSEVYPMYLRSHGMSTTDAMVFLGSFIVTYNFNSMQEAMTRTGLTLGFFGGIAVLGWFYQLLFMPETKNLTLEEIDLVFSKPTRKLVMENLKSSKETLSLLVRFRFKEVFAAYGKDRREDVAGEA